jgi:hypothetical protein
VNKFFRHPVTNAVGISVFSLFYGVIFIIFSNLIKSQVGISKQPFWQVWDTFLNQNGHQFIAFALLPLTAVVVLLLLMKHKPYDEYHTAILVKCLAVSVILTLAAIAVFFVVVLCDPNGIISKFTLFISVNWATVVIADLIYLLLCGRQ